VYGGGCSTISCSQLKETKSRKMEILSLIFKIFLGLIIFRVIYRLVVKKKKNGIIQNAENRIKDYKTASSEQLMKHFDDLSEQIQLHPNVPKLNFFRAIIAAKLSTMLENKELVKKYYINSTYDLKIWTGIPRSAGGAETPAMDTQFISNLRRADGKNRELMDIYDTVGELGNGKSFDEALGQQLAASLYRDQKMQND